MATAVVHFTASAVSDRGSKRPTNEDAFGFSVEHGVYLVCDGMGGAAAGEIASSLAVEEVMAQLVRRTGIDAAPMPQLAEQAICAGNKAIFSTLFLVSYIIHHALHGDVRYPHDAPLRMVYLPLLASHITLAIVALPLVLVTFFFSLTGRIRQHRKVARWTFPLWLYVSVTGVITYVMLRLAQG